MEGFSVMSKSRSGRLPVWEPVQGGEVFRMGCRQSQHCCRLYCMAGRSRHLDPTLKNWDKAEARQQGGYPVHFKNTGESQAVTEKKGQKS